MNDCDQHFVQNIWFYYSSESRLTCKIYLVLAKYIHTKLIGASFGVILQIYKKNTIIVYHSICHHLQTNPSCSDFVLTAIRPPPASSPDVRTPLFHRAPGSARQ